MTHNAFIRRHGPRLIVCITLGSMVFTCAAAKLRCKPGAIDPNGRPAYEVGILAYLYEFCPWGKPASAETFMQEYSRSLIQMCARDAHLATCRVLPGAARYELIGRLTGTNAVRVRVAFGCNRAGLIETLTFDRPVRLPDGAVHPAGTTVPIETVMRMLALARNNTSNVVQDLVVAHAIAKMSYASKDSTKAKYGFMVRGSAPTAYNSFSNALLTQFAITPAPLPGTAVVVHAFSRMYAGVVNGPRPKYIHYFVTYDSHYHAHKDGLFIATLHDAMLDFVYKMKLDNRPGDMVSAANYDALRAYTATNPPLRGLGFGTYIFNIGSETHTVTNVPLFGRVTKGSSSTTKVK